MSILRRIFSSSKSKPAVADEKQAEPTPSMKAELKEVEEMLKVLNKELDCKTATKASTSAKSNNYWAKGTGYGHGAASSTLDFDALKKAQKAKYDAVEGPIKKLIAAVKTIVAKGSTADKQKTGALVKSSYLLPMLVDQLSHSILDLESNQAILTVSLDLTTLLASDPDLAQFLLESKQLMHSVAALKQSLEMSEKMSKNALSKGKVKDDTKSANPTASTVTSIEELAMLLEKATMNKAPEKLVLEKKSSRAADKLQQLEANYIKALESERFGDLPKFSAHHFLTNNPNEALTRPVVKRLSTEFATLNNALPVTLSSSIFMRFWEEDMRFVQFMVIAPDETPYGRGCFLFDAYFPSAYPNSPPKVNLQTTGGGSVRFNPNLYDSGYVCLSLLGTWSGSQSEGWLPNASTFLQVVISVQSLIFVAQPYFNEPSYESSMGTPGGQAASDGYNRNIRQQTMRWAMIEMIKNPPLGFEKIVKTHFAMQKDLVLNDCAKWVEADANLKPLYEELQKALATL